MRDGEKNGGNGSADSLSVDILAERVQEALGRVQAASKTLERCRAEAVKPGKRAQAAVETCLRILQEVESDLYVADYLAKALLPQPVDEGDRNLLQSMLIAASGGFPSLPDDLSRPTRKQRSPGRPKPTRWKARGAG